MRLSPRLQAATASSTGVESGGSVRAISSVISPLIELRAESAARTSAAEPAINPS
jgi:hypothetical protein